MIAGQIQSNVGDWSSRWLAAWNRFWFTPRLPHTLAVMRIFTGLMLLYTHLVLASDLLSFLGEHAWINNATARQLHDGTFGQADAGWSYLWYIDSPALLWLHQLVTIVVTACFAAGLLTRLSGPVALLLQLMYLHRLTGALFGLDQIVTYATMYLVLSPCGSCFSVDAWLRGKLGQRLQGSRRLRWMFPDPTPAISANIATRLLQLHLCVIYLFGGLAKARGQTWWDGTALWYSVGNYEYQSVDMTWLASFPHLATAMVHITLAWEIFYCALIWPRLTRPLVLALAFAVHGGIAMFLGMVTFGVMMISANLVFVEPRWWLRVVGWQPLDQHQEGGELAEELISHQAELDASLREEAELEESLEEYEDPLPEADSLGRSLDEREERLRVASRKLREKTERLKERELKYRDRVKRLKEREKKIKDAVERKRQAKADRGSA